MLQLVTETEIPGGWTEQRLRIGGRTFDLVLPAVPDALLENIATLPLDQQDQHDVYWAKLWQAAPITAARVLAHAWSPGTRALELGCGVGLVGLAGLATGLNVTFSDYEPMALRTSQENARRNGFPDAPARIVDWRDPPTEQFSVLLACDVLYNQAMHAALLQFISAALAQGGSCWIGDAGRYHVDKFLHLAAQQGFQVRLEDDQGRPLAAPVHGRFQLLLLSRG